MKAGIITVNSRKRYLERLVSLIEPEVEELVIFNDESLRGVSWNHKRCMSEMLPTMSKGEPFLFLDDDMITVKGWRDKWEEIHKQAHSPLYSLFSRQKFMFKEDNLSRGFVTKCQRRGFYGCASIYINQQDLIDRVDKWFKTEGKYVLPIARQNHYDVIIQDYFVHNNIPWTTTTPTLFEHLGEVSTLGHNVGRSVNYIGNE